MSSLLPSRSIGSHPRTVGLRVCRSFSLTRTRTQAFRVTQRRGSLASSGCREPLRGSAVEMGSGSAALAILGAGGARGRTGEGCGHGAM